MSEVGITLELRVSVSGHLTLSPHPIIAQWPCPDQETRSRSFILLTHNHFLGEFRSRIVTTHHLQTDKHKTLIQHTLSSDKIANGSKVMHFNI